MSEFGICQDDNLVTIAVDGADDRKLQIRRIHAVITDIDYDLDSFSLYYKKVNDQESAGFVDFVDCRASCSINKEDYIGKEVFLLVSEQPNELLALHVIETGEQKSFVEECFYEYNYERGARQKVSKLWSRMWMGVVWLNVAFAACTLLFPDYRSFFAGGSLIFASLLVSFTWIENHSIKMSAKGRFNSFKLQIQKILDRAKDDSASVLMLRKTNAATKPFHTAP